MIPRWSGAGVLAVGLLIAASEAEAQWLGLRPLRGQLGGRFQQDTFSGDRRGTWGNFQEWVNLRLAGSVYHPGLVSFSIGLRPQWRQSYSVETLGTESDATARLGYDFRAWILRNKPLRLTLHASRLNGTTSEVLGDGREFDRTRFGGELLSRNTVLPFRVEYRDESVSEFLDGVLPNGTLRDDRTRTAWLRANNSKLNLYLSWVGRENFQFQVNRNIYTGDLRHRFRWGKGSFLLSRFGLTTTRTVVTTSRTTWQEQVRLRHTRDFSSNLQYTQTTSTSGFSNSRSRILRAAFQYDPSPALRTAVVGSGNYTRSTAAKRTVYRVGPSAGYHARLPLNTQFSMSGTFTFERAEQETLNGSVPVVNELHVVESSREFTLEERLADPASVVITDSRQAIVYQTDVDYRLLAAGDFVEVFVLPSGRIAVGDTVVVDYQYQVTESGGYRGIFASYGATVRKAKFELFARHVIRQPTDGESALLFLNSDDLTVGVAYSPPGGGTWSTNFRAQYRRVAYNTVRTDNYSASANVWARFVRTLTTGLSGSVRRARGTKQNLDLLTGRLLLTWVPTGNLSLRGEGAAWWWRRHELGSNVDLGAVFNLRYRLGQTNLNAQLVHRRREDTRDFASTRVMVGLTRDF